MSFRIGELSRRTGVSPELLRAWEQRYGLLAPTRSAGGYRLYDEGDEARVAAMKIGLGQGLAAAEAARAALKPTHSSGNVDVAAERAALAAALAAFDGGAADAILDRLLAALTFETVAREVVLPYLVALGQRWERGEAGVAEEHFAANLLRGRLLGIARGWERGIGPRAILACAPGELHELPLIVFGIALREQGWRVAYLGADTPVDALVNQAGEADAVVVAAAAPERLERAVAELASVASRSLLAVGGRGATAELARRIDALPLPGDPFEAAEVLSAAAATSEPELVSRRRPRRRGAQSPRSASRRGTP